MNRIEMFWWASNPPNFGDEVSPVIVQHFTDQEVKWVERGTKNKLLAIGSIIHCIKAGDTVWGSGTNRSGLIEAPEGVRFLSFRGKITRGKIIGRDLPEVYGDPALLLPLVYNPIVRKSHGIGYIPHYLDYDHVLENVRLGNNDIVINIRSGWRRVIREILSCERVECSAMHGLIAAEAYGVPATWAIYGERVRGQVLKTQDYFSGTDRDNQKPFEELESIPNLGEIQSRILRALRGGGLTQGV